MTTGKTRFAFIDQYRGWAVIFMIETHVLNTFLRRDLFVTSWFKVIDFINGLVAPSFLFLAGFSFALVASRKWDDLLKCGRPFWKQLSRYGLILAIGYCLHMPRYSFRVLLQQIKWHENHLFWGVDILHTIAISLIVMLLLVPLLRRRHILFPLLATAAILISLLTLGIHARPIENMVSAPFVGYLKRIRWSQFPLFPWASFVFFGAFFSYLWQLAREKEKERIYFSYVMIFAGGLDFVLTLSLFRPQLLMRGINFSPVLPVFLFLKLGLVLMLLTGFHWLQGICQERPLVVTRVGQESLLAYAFHIVFIYGSFWRWSRHFSLSFIIGQTRPPLQILATALALIALTIFLCLAWHGLKKKNPPLSRRLHLVMWALVLLFFVVH